MPRAQSDNLHHTDAELDDSLRRSHLSETLASGELLPASRESSARSSAPPVTVEWPRFPHSANTWCGIVFLVFIGPLLLSICVAVVRYRLDLWDFRGLLIVCAVFLSPMAGFTLARRRFYRSRMRLDDRQQIVLERPGRSPVVIDPARATLELTVDQGWLTQFALAWIRQNDPKRQRHGVSTDCVWTPERAAIANRLGATLGVSISTLTIRRVVGRHRPHTTTHIQPAPKREKPHIGPLSVFDWRIGGMGAVFFVHSMEQLKEWVGLARADRPHALKTSQELLSRGEPRPGARQRFEREAAMWLQIPPHRHVVEAHRIETIQGVPYLVIDYHPGGSVRELLRRRASDGTPARARKAAATATQSQLHASSPSLAQQLDAAQWSDAPPGGRLSSIELARLAGQMALALEAATAAVPGLVHGDVKPANILCDNDNGELVFKLTDFGLSVVAGMSGNAATVNGGTPGYLAPEAWARDATPTQAQDIYALGVTLFECATGQLPFRERDVRAMAEAHATQPVPPLPDAVAPPVARLIRDCMCKSPAHRPSIVEVIKACRGLLNDASMIVCDQPLAIGMDAAESRVVCLLQLHCAAGAMRVLERVPLNARGGKWFYWRGVINLALDPAADTAWERSRVTELDAAYLARMGPMAARVPTPR
ncbi:MAG: serine/threonine-protein kinase [Planctomycetota bacterium]